MLSQSDAPTRASLKDSLLAKIHDRSAVVGVVGLGYVGLPFAVEKAKVGYKVLGIEQNPNRLAKINRGENYIGDVSDEELAGLVQTGHITAVENFDRVAEMDVIVICVPTPLTKNLTPDLQYVRNVIAGIQTRIRPGQLISLESTTYPGTTDEVILPALLESGLQVETDFFLAHSPERVDPGNARYTTKNTNKVVGGVGPESLDVAVAFYSQTIDHVVPVSSAKVAEMVKVFENTYRSVNIALVNELALLCDRMGINVWEMLDAAFTKPFGIQPFYPGPGVGGHCIPIDPHYLEWKAKEHNFNTHFIALAGEINRRMPEFVRDKALRVLNREGIPLSRSRVLMLGVAYKKDLDDWRESPALEIFELLEAEGAKVEFHDPFVPRIQLAGRPIEGVPFNPAAIGHYDLVVIATDHSNVNYAELVRNARCVLDTRNATRKVTDGREKVTLL